MYLFRAGHGRAGSSHAQVEALLGDLLENLLGIGHRHLFPELIN